MGIEAVHTRPVRLDPKYADWVAEQLIIDHSEQEPTSDANCADKAAKLIIEDEPPKLVDEDKKND